MKFTESSSVELKVILNADFKKEIVAFANSDGGTIYVGISDDGKVVGVKNADTEMEKISSIIHDAIHPDLIPFTNIEQIELDGKKIIKVSVSKGGRPPYHLIEKGLRPSGVYIRHGVASVPASEEQIRDMIRETDGVVYDKSRSMNQELTFNYAADYFAKKEVSFTDKNKFTLGIIDCDGCFTNTGLLISDQCDFTIKCAVFEGEGKLVFKTRKEFAGSILKQLEDSFEFINLANNLHADIKGLDRVETYDYPPYAIREALLNTIIHRDYNFSGSTIINIYSNRIEFISLGGLVKELTIQDILHGASQTRNTVIANIFYRLRLVESYGTGLQRILETYSGKKEQPTIEPLPSSFIVTLPKIQHTIEKTNFSEDNSVENKILSLFNQKDYITRKDVQTVMNCSSFPARNIINQLISENRIKSVGQGRSIKYILSNKQEEI